MPAIAPTPPPSRALAPVDPAARRRSLLADALVFAVVVAMNSHVFTSDYVMKDEMMLVGWAPGWPLGFPLDSAAGMWKICGRWLGGLLWPLPFAFAADDPVRLRLVRFVLVVILAVTAVVTRRLLDRSLRSAAATTLLVLAIFAQRPFWALAGYSVGCFSIASSLLPALAAFALAVPRDVAPAAASRTRIAGAFVCLAVVMQIHQGMAFFGLVPLVAAVLGEWPRRSRQAWSLLLAMVVVFAVSAALYAWNLSKLHAESRLGYSVGENAMALTNSPLAALRIALDPRHYWPAFKLWSFPFPFERIRMQAPQTVDWSLRIMTAWALLVAVAAVIDARRSDAPAVQIAAKWATVLACLGLAALPILADSPGGIPHSMIRPHTSAVAVGVVMVTGVWALRTIAARWTKSARTLLLCAVVAVVATWCVGARSSLRRGLVAPGAAQLAFVRSALAGEGQISRILVVVPSRNGCVFDPCDGWSGGIAPDDWHVRRPGFYRWAVALERGRTEPPPKIVFLEGPPVLPSRETDLVVDWNDFVRPQARRRGVDWKSLPRAFEATPSRPPGREGPADS